MSEIVQAHIPCPYCGSHDAATLYDDGHTYCFSCHHTEFPKEGVEVTKHAIIPHEDMEIKTLRARGLSAETCERYGYYVTKTQVGTVQVAGVS